MPQHLKQGTAQTQLMRTNKPKDQTVPLPGISEHLCDCCSWHHRERLWLQRRICHISRNTNFSNINMLLKVLPCVYTAPHHSMENKKADSQYWGGQERQALCRSILDLDNVQISNNLIISIWQCGKGSFQSFQEPSQDFVAEIRLRSLPDGENSQLENYKNIQVEKGPED